jgi:regulation of enolase protein 1 (concanavalin A-like superfamily)
VKKGHRVFFVFLVVCLVSTFCLPFVRASSELWSQVHGSGVAYSLASTSDGGFVLAGFAVSLENMDSSMILIKTNSNGELEWNKTFGGTGPETANCVIETFDGGFAVGGDTFSFGAGGSDFFLVKTYSTGNVEWNQTFGGTGGESVQSLIQATDGGFVLTGGTTSNSESIDVWLVKTDSAGNMIWNKRFGGAETELTYSLTATADGGYALCGITGSIAEGASDFLLIKTDADGNQEWIKTYHGEKSDSAFALVEASDGGFVLVGSTNFSLESKSDVLLIKTDSSGNLQWKKTYGGEGSDSVHSLVETGDGYTLGGFTQSTGAGKNDFWLIKTDLQGNELWNYTYGGLEDDYCHSLVQTPDGGYVLAGYSRSFGGISAKVWLIKTDEVCIPEFAFWTVLALIGTALLLVTVFIKKYTKQQKQKSH